MITVHSGELKRFIVPVRCKSHETIWTPEGGVDVFATGKDEARAAAIEKMRDKYLRHQNLRTDWIVTGEPVEG